MQPLIAFFGGMVFLAFIVFAVYLLIFVRALNKTAERLYGLLEPFVSDKSFRDTAKHLHSVLIMFPQFMNKMTLLTQTFDVFNKAMWKKDGEAPPAPTAVAEPSSPRTPQAGQSEELKSAFFAYGEEDAKVEEDRAILRKSGIETDDNNAPDIPMAQVNFADAETP